MNDIFKKNIKSYSILFFLWLLTLSAYLFFNIKTNSYPWQNNIQILRHSIDYILGFTSFCLFLAMLIKLNKFLRIIAYLFIALLFINILISASCYLIYHSIFDLQMAYNILITNSNEASSFSTTLIIPILISLIFIVFYSIMIEKLVPKIKFNILTIVFSVAWIFVPYLWLQKEKNDLKKFRIENPERQGVRSIKNKTIFYNLPEFLKGYQHLKEINSVLIVPPNFSMISKSKNSESIDNIVVLIGESARKQNMSIYGYPRNTTPQMIKEKGNMFLFENAVSPASYTNQAVPLSLSNIRFDSYAKNDFTTLNNNIVSVGKNFNYSSYWITHSISPEVKLLGNDVEEMIITSASDDAELISHLINLSKSKKNIKTLFVLHFLGSHPDAKHNYPSSHAIFTQNNSIDEYDNSIAYTDYLLGKVFDLFRNTNTAIVYYSDHGQEFKNQKFYHSQSQSANQVPLWIWYGNEVPKSRKNTGKETLQTSTRVVYDIVLELMGLNNSSSESHVPAKFLKKGNVVLFNDLNE